jgi:putative membrane protein
MRYNGEHKELNNLHILTVILVVLVALEHIGIMGIELLGTDQLLAKSFDLPLTEVQRPHLRTALANQGLYNGFVALSLFLALFIPTGAIMKIMLTFFLASIFILAAYGALTVAKKIIFVQGLPALITLILTMIFF